MEQSICGTWPAAALEEVLSSGAGSGGVTIEPRTDLRGIRLPPSQWKADDFSQRIELLASWGFNAVLLDAFDLPLVEPFHKDEDHPASWEAMLAEVAEQLHGQGWWTMAVVPVQLDLGRPDSSGKGLDEPIPCRQTPLHRRRILHRFESILKNMRGFHAIGIAVSEWPRCQCEACRRVTFEEESAYYLRAFSAVMKRYARDHEFWALPDAPSFSLLQEIRAEVPSSARFLVEPQDPELKSGLLPAQSEEGMILDMSIPHQHEWLDTHQFAGLLHDWEQESEPRLLVAEMGNTSQFPLSLVSFLRLAWQTSAGGVLPEALLYRLTLPKEQWKEWQEWKGYNLGTKKRIRDHTPLSTRKTAETKAAPLGPGASSFQPDLASTLRNTHQRLDLEERISPLLKRVLEIPEGIPLESQCLVMMAEIQAELTDLAGDEMARKILEEVELRALENLRDKISLLLSETRAGTTWSVADVPDLHLWIELLRDEE